MIKNIIFDFGGVILKHRSTITEEIIAKIFNIPIEKALQLWLVDKPALVTGRITSQDFLTKLQSNLQSNRSVDELMRLWRDLYKTEAAGVNYELLDLIERLKKNYNVYLFSDTIDVHDEYNCTRNIYEKFHIVFKSFEEHLRKPDPAAFYNILQKTNSKPEESLFIDDLPENVNTAKELGMKAILFKNVNQLLREFQNFGVNVNGH